MYKLYFTVSLNTYTKLNRYATSLNISIQNSIRFLLVEQIRFYYYDKQNYTQLFNSCKPRETLGSYDSDLDKVKQPKRYSIEVSEYIYDNIQHLKKEYGVKTNTLVNNLLHIAINNKLQDYDSYYATNYNDLTAQTKQYAIPLSNVFSNKLHEISEVTGIRVNKLISLIIGNYLIEHYTEYNGNEYYNEETGKHYMGLW